MRKCNFVSDVIGIQRYTSGEVPGGESSGRCVSSAYVCVCLCVLSRVWDLSAGSSTLVCALHAATGAQMKSMDTILPEIKVSRDEAGRTAPCAGTCGWGWSAAAGAELRTVF